LSSEKHQLRFNQSYSNDLNLEFNANLIKARRQSRGQLTPLNVDGFEQAPFIFGVDIKYQSYETSLSADLPLNENHHLFVGASYTNSQIPRAALASNFDLYGEFELLNSFTVFDRPEQRSVLDKTRTTRSLYAQLQSQLTDKLDATFGLRNDSYNDVDSKLNPRISFNYSMSSNHSFKLIYGEAYRVPSLGDLYDEESGLTLGNESLNPTTLKSTELTYSYLDANDYFNLVLFNNDIDNLIGFTSGDIVKLDNIASNQARGIEAEWKKVISEDLTANIMVTRMLENDSVIHDDTELSPSEWLAPDTMLTAIVDYDGFKDLNINLQYFWHDGVEVVNNSTDHNINLVTNYALNDDTQVRFNIKNLLDAEQASGSYISLGTDQMGSTVQQYPLRGRELELSVRYLF